jgi:3',5'-cyclic-AMP phosphodiesterase
MPETPLLVAQITDTHLFADDDQEMLGCRTAATLQSVVDQIGQLPAKPDVLLLTGDLSQDETPESYQRLQRSITPLGIPTYWLPGNHDQEVAVMEQVLRSDLISSHKSFQIGSWAFILLNSMLHRQVQGRLLPETLRLLDQQLQQFSHQPTLVALHHPPLPVEAEWMNKIGLENPEDLFTVLDRHPQVKLVVFGHIHQEFEDWRNGVRYLGAPSTCVQFKPYSPTFAIDDQPPGFRLIHLSADGSHSTEVRRVALNLAPSPS